MNQLIRRAAPGVAVAGVALSSVWMLDPALHPQQEDLVPASAPDSSSASGNGDSGAGSAGDSSAGSAASGSTTGSGGAGSSATAAAACDSGTTTQTGDEVTTRWGPVQVRMTFAAGGTACAVEAVTYPDGDPHSARISQTAIPILDARATADGVTFDAVSGATYTSQGYRQSMQSILDRR